jgi:hypothetical protein
MGGMMNYVMIVPGIAFLLLSLIPAATLGRHGRTAPMWVSMALIVGTAAALLQQFTVSHDRFRCSPPSVPLEATNSPSPASYALGGLTP